MHEALDVDVSAWAPAGYRLGDPIALEDLLALPPDDDRRFVRDAEGRLAPMAPEDPRWHRYPLAMLGAWLLRQARPEDFVCQEPGVAFERIWTLDGRLLPASRLGPRTLEPDLALFADPPTFVEDERRQARGFDPARLRLVVEILSQRTHRQDLGLGAADAVDRPRSYRESGVPEYWVLNPGRESLGLPPRTGLFLRSAGGRWEPLGGEGLEHAAARVGDLQPVAAGRIASPALGRSFELGALWEALIPRT